MKNENGHATIETKLQHVHNRVSGSTIAGTLYPQIVGQAIGGTGALFELGCDAARSARIHRRKLNEKAVIEKMVALNRDTDTLLNQLNAASDQSREEAIFLREIKREILAEFMRLEGQAGNISAGRLIEDSFSLIRNTVGLTGNSINVDAVLHDNKRRNGDGTILNLIAASDHSKAERESMLPADRIKRQLATVERLQKETTPGL